jgi:hypothetical protein
VGSFFQKFKRDVIRSSRFAGIKDSGKLDSLFVSLKIDQNLFGFSWKLTSREENKFLRLFS